MQAQAITAQTAQIASQTAQISALEKKIERLERMLETVQDILTRQYGLRVEVNGEYVTLVDEGTRQSRTVKIQLAPAKEEGKA